MESGGMHKLCKANNECTRLWNG